MSDRELLEMAAKAAGYPYAWMTDCRSGEGVLRVRLAGPSDDPEAKFDCMNWSPLKDDGEALRLAVTLGMNLEVTGSDVYACCRGNFSEPAKPDACAALRRAIVRAAAEIGRAMP